MSDNYKSPFKTVIIPLVAYGILATIYGIITHRQQVSFSVHDVFCLIGIGVPILAILIAYHLLAKYREKHPAKESVQKLGLDD